MIYYQTRSPRFSNWQIGRINGFIQKRIVTEQKIVGFKMVFDINQLENIDDDSDGEEELAEYKDALLEQFSKSTIGQAFIKTHMKTRIGSWTEEIIRYGYLEKGITIPRMTVEDVEEIVKHEFPRRITIFTEEQADDAISELVAFWQFLQSEYQLPSSDKILEFLNRIKPKFLEIMTSSGDFGMAKTMALMGHAAGFDMTDEQEIGRFMMSYNAGIMDGLSGGDPLIGKRGFSGKGPVPRDRRTEKAKRKKANASRRKNRK